MTKRIKAVLLMIVCLAGLLYGQKSDASALNFSVATTIPDNQIDKNQTYFDLLMTPGQKQTLNIVLSNTSKKDVTVLLNVASATTNDNGVVEYAENAIAPDATLQYDLADLVTIPEKVVLKPAAEKTIDIVVTMPSTPYTGLIAGGITFEEQSESSDDAKNNEAAIRNDYRFVKALLIRQTIENGLPDLKLLAAKATQSNYRNVISANLQNPNHTYLEDLAVKAEVRKKGSKDVLYELIKSQMKMAPNSQFNFLVPLNGQKFEAGDYTIKIEAYGNQTLDGKYDFGVDVNDNPLTYSQHWTLEREFHIDAKEAKKLNSQAVELEEDRSWLYIAIGAAMLILVIVIVILLILLKKKRK